MRRILVAALPVAAGLTLASAVLFPHLHSSPDTPGSSPVASAADRGSIAALQARLRTHPRDGRSWSTLALAYVDQARLTGQSAWYPRAQGAVDKALTLGPSDDAALVAAGVLANSEHRFADGLRWGDKAAAANPYSVQAQTVRTDALVELGRYDEARAAATAADDLKPGIPTFTRISYLDELHGDVKGAADLMRRGSEPGTDRADIAFCRFHLAELARGTGDYATAAREYASALAADPTYLPARAGQARVMAARGDLRGAATIYRSVVAQLPLPQYATELGEVLEAIGAHAEAEQQYTLVRAEVRLSRAAGVIDGPEVTVFEADHGSAAEAVRLGQAEWSRRHSIHVADALGWALFVAGKPAQALPYAQAATRLGTKDARLLYHRGMIERALGRTADARKSLSAALALDPGFSPLAAPRARAALAGLR